MASKKRTKGWSRTMATRTAAATADGLLTRAALAVELGINAWTIVRWTQDGCPVARPGSRGVPAYYRLADVERWRRARDAATSNGSGPSSSLAQARTRREHAAALLSEQTHAARAGQLLAAEAVAQVWGAHVSAVRARLLAWSTVLTDRVTRAAMNDGIGAVEAVLDEEVRRVLIELASGPIAPVDAADDTPEDAR
jgi:phage terminase Nu1 subunit (DNA packaging protein)